ncbi:two-component system CheB/CheR fusion protein [Spirosoma oryzae]|uniref:Two-component system CheB/CheR fusion protein n=1 Tax=Spirosoma oryzae TaxID=1469603 RepID=A0A2T0RXH0_9BACT|nr:CheR family methyltransferase [Spirosoma oryzae]PRY25885.1 two-component system CheB/CheR fusion protein [Spirosoma oryzae]
MSKKKTASKKIDNTVPGQTLIVGIGCSAGGVEALTQFFESVTADSGLAYVVILHLSPDYDSQLTQILQSVASIPVIRVEERVTVVANHVYVVPPDKHLQMADGDILVLPNARIEDRRAPVDIFFRTLAESHGAQAVGVILSGTGANGSMGLKRIKEEGGAAFVQSPREAAFNEMPRHAIATGLVDDILPVAQIPGRLLAYAQNRDTVVISLEPRQDVENQQQALRDVFALLRQRTGHDFSNYKRPTLLRRLERRINVRNLPGLPEYVVFLREHPDETQSLLNDLLISVTNFFRDRPVFTTLEQQVIPLLTHEKKGDNTLRIWVAGCATGEEAYSLAMLCAERTMDVLDAPRVQIFATDIDQTAIAIAREGLYTINDAADVSPERLRRFFTLEGEQYRIRREIREMVLFAYHNVLKDPPFSRLNLVSCRNLLIYLNQTAQQRVLETIHFALNPGGYLLLGLSETTDGTSDLFAPVNREQHLFQSRSVPTRSFPVPESSALLASQRETAPEPAPRVDERPNARLSYGELHQRLLEQYAPPSIIVNDEYDILHVSERAGRYLQIGGGEPSKNLLKLIRPELRLELRTAFYQANQQQMNVAVRQLKLRLDNQIQTLTIHVRPVTGEGDSARGFILVLFEPTPEEDVEPDRVLTSVEPVAHHLEEELIRAKAQLRSANEHHELQAEELKATNEELQAINEELRSSAEELETSKEELQSINEELTTVNQELKVKVEEISLVGDNLQNLINSTDMATLFLDRSLRVNLFTPATREIFNLIPTDFGRPLTDITNRLVDTHLLGDTEQVLATLQPVEREVRTIDRQVYLMRVLPYRTTDDRINGIVLTFVDITQRKAAEEANYFLASIIESSQDSVITLNFEGVITSWNKASETLYGYSAAEAIGQSLGMLTLPQDLSELLNLAEKIKQSQRVETHETVRITKDGQKLTLEVVLSPVKDLQGQVIGVSSVARDITERKAAEAALRESEKRFRLTIEAARMGTWDWNLATDEVIWNEQHFRLFGMEPQPDPVSPSVYFDHVHPNDRDRIARQLQEAIASQGVFDAEFCAVLDDGSQRWMSGYGRVVEEIDGSAAHMSGVMFDIDKRKRAEEALRESDQRKDEFLAMLAHELRNPLAPVRNILQTLGLSAGQNETMSAAIAMMNRQVDHLVRLVDDLLDVSRINRGKITLRLEPLDLNTLLQETVVVMQSLFKQRRIELSVSASNEPIYLQGDSTRLMQVINNLLTNGTRYTPEGGHVWVKLDQVNQGADVMARLRVSDNGIGLANDQLERIFELFAQVDNSPARSQGGLGLGLTLVKRLAELHGGRVEARSPGLGQGSEFVVYLPVLTGINEHTDAQPVPADLAIAKPRILVVDDNQDAADSFAMLLELSGYTVDVCYSGEQAIAAAEQGQPEVVLLDIGMPGLNGYETARLIRQQSWGRNLILIALTGYGQADDKRLSQEAGFDGHLVKPVDLETLTRLLTSIVPPEDRSAI